MNPDVVEGRIAWAIKHFKVPMHASAEKIIGEIFVLVRRDGENLPKRKRRKFVAKLIRERVYGCPENKHFNQRRRWDSRPYDAEHYPIIWDDAQNDDFILKEFYSSWEWKRLRYNFLKNKKRRCCCCGATPESGAQIVVDHIKPVRRYWSLRLNQSNLQVLCNDCNMGKSSTDETDWR